MLTAQLFGRLLTATTRTCQLTTKRFASTSSMFQTTDKFMLDKAILQYTRKYFGRTLFLLLLLG